RVVEGGSTITQQLAKNLFLTQERTFRRKFKEIFLAFQIERHYNKQEILELYLNQVYFGNSAYGIETAARVYFGKHASELSLPESATIAALLRAPNDYNPYRFPEKAKTRRNLVLERMKELGLATPQEVLEAKEQPILTGHAEMKNAPYFIEYIRQQVE